MLLITHNSLTTVVDVNSFSKALQWEATIYMQNKESLAPIQASLYCLVSVHSVIIKLQ